MDEGLFIDYVDVEWSLGLNQWLFSFLLKCLEENETLEMKEGRYLESISVHSPLRR
jgi:hypothetical protein